MKYIVRQIRTQAQAEAPRLLLAVLSLLIVGLMLSPREKPSLEVTMEGNAEVIQASR